jgi:hypothetical protein
MLQLGCCKLAQFIWADKKRGEAYRLPPFLSNKDIARYLFSSIYPRIP